MSLRITICCILLSVVAFGQTPEVNRRAISAVPSPPTHAIALDEASHYNQMYQLAKAEADRAHQDVWASYGINTSFLLALVAVILTIQFFAVKRKIKRIRKFTKNQIHQLRNDITSLQENFLGITNNLEQQERQSRERISFLALSLERAHNKIIAVPNLVLAQEYFERKQYSTALSMFIEYAKEYITNDFVDTNATKSLTKYLVNVERIEEKEYLSILRLIAIMNEKESPIASLNTAVLNGKIVYRIITNNGVQETQIIDASSIKVPAQEKDGQ